MIALRRLVALVCGALIGLLPPAAAGHVTATGLAVIAVSDSTIRFRLTIVPSELPAPAAQLVTRAIAGSRPDAERLAGALRRAVVFRVDGAACRPGRIALRDLGGGLKAQLDYALHCPAAPGRLELAEDWGGLFGEHYVTIATLRAPNGGGEHLLGPGPARLAVDLQAEPPAGIAGFVHLGIMHILTGYDHLLFLFALLVGAGSVWRVLGIASMFTLAHSITLSLAVLKVVHPPAAVIEPLIAASIVFVAVENLFGEGRPWHRYVVTFVFGLVHGLGFADALAPLALQGWSLVSALAGFNLGVEVGQAMAIAVVVPVLFAIGRLARGIAIGRYASLAVAMAGAYWLFERVYPG